MCWALARGPQAEVAGARTGSVTLAPELSGLSGYCPFAHSIPPSALWPAELPSFHPPSLPGQAWTGFGPPGRLVSREGPRPGICSSSAAHLAAPVWPPPAPAQSLQDLRAPGGRDVGPELSALLPTHTPITCALTSFFGLPLGPDSGPRAQYIRPAQINPPAPALPQMRKLRLREASQLSTGRLGFRPRWLLSGLPQPAKPCVSLLIH